jgi:ribokinase
VTGAGHVVVVGSVNADLVVRVPRLPRPGETVLGDEFEEHGGGKGANQAVAAQRAGATTHLVAAVGDDELGRRQLDDLRREGLDLSGVRTLPDVATGVALITVDSAGENQIAVASGANQQLGADEVEDALARLDPPAGWVCLLVLEVDDAAVEAAVRRAAGAGGRLLLNPAPARPITDSVLATHPILTPNETEAAFLAGDEDPEGAARTLCRRTGAPVVVTLGPRGALVLTEADGEVARIPAPQMEVIDSTGAGDTFNGVLAARLAAGAQLTEAVRWAVAAASLSVGKRGARGGMPTADQITTALDS